MHPTIPSIINKEINVIARIFKNFFIYGFNYGRIPQIYLRLKELNGTMNMGLILALFC
jgi:hypothetical protein